MPPPPEDPLLTAARRTVDEQFASLSKNLRVQADKSRRDLIHQLAQGFRRLRTFENEHEWITALLDVAAPFCFRAVFFTVLSGKLEWKAARNVEVRPGLTLPLADARAFAATVESGEITVALKTSNELSATLAQVLGEEPTETFALIPIHSNGRTVAIFYAEDADIAGLEMITVMAGAALESHQRKSKTSDGALLQIVPVVALNVPQEEEELHLKAQRFARSRTAEIRLYEADAVQVGRLQKNLYKALQVRLDDAREGYRNQFTAGSSTMVDYLDREFIRTLAQGDRTLMGPEYPGALV